jgi:thiamine biosynthesis protein ThiI
MKFVSLVSSGIDSPVAAYLLSRRGEDIVLVHVDNQPFTDEKGREHFIRIAKHLKKHITGDLKGYIVHHGDCLSTVATQCTRRFTCVLCKRMMLRYAQRIAKIENADAIIMGDSLGQVASQTLQNLYVIDQAVSIPVLRPLIGLDKVDIVRIAEAIGTYPLSIMKSTGCTAVPDKPATQAKLDQIQTEEEKLSVDALAEQAVEQAELLAL